MDLIDLTRLATLAVMPLSLSLSLALIALLCLRRRSPRPAVFFLLASLLCLGVFSLPVVANALMGSLEARYPPTDPATCDKADAIVVLGGAVRPRLVEDPYPRLHQGSDRVAVAAALYRAGCAPVVFIAAGGKHHLPVIESEALAIREVLGRLGVPNSAIQHEQTSRNTGQNADRAWAALSAQGIKQVLLVSSAWHLPRAVGEFKAVGFEVLPVGADYRGFDASENAWMRWLPAPDALARSHLALKEYLGSSVLYLPSPRG